MRPAAEHKERQSINRIATRVMGKDTISSSFKVRTIPNLLSGLRTLLNPTSTVLQVPFLLKPLQELKAVSHFPKVDQLPLSSFRKYSTMPKLRILIAKRNRKQIKIMQGINTFNK